MFFLPFAALIAVTVIYREELGLKALLIYWFLWIAVLVLTISCKFLPYIFIAFEALLAAAMMIHVKKNQAF